MLSIGDPFPTFSCADQFGIIHTHNAISQGQSVLYFYPKDETPGCTRQACTLRDDYQRWHTLGVQLFGVSPDPVEDHLKFAQRHQLPFTLLSDPRHLLCDSVGVWGTQRWGEHEYEGVARTTFVIDQGIVIARYLNVRVEGHWSEVWRYVSQGLSGDGSGDG